MNYPEDLKQKMIKRMLPPNNEPISKIAREEGIAEQTLRNWQKAAREKGIAAPVFAPMVGCKGCKGCEGHKLFI